jgi:malate synthase
MKKSERNFVQIGGLSVAQSLQAFIEDEALPRTGLFGAMFWNGLAVLVRDFGEHNRQLLKTRDALQSSIDAYHRDQLGQPLNLADYEGFLRKIGYLLPQIEDFTIRTRNVDEEIAQVAGPQLVVPLSNSRYALNAANARWGSLYDALQRMTVPRGRAHTTPFVASASSSAGARCSIPPFRSRKAVIRMLSPIRLKAALWSSA